MSKLIIHRKRCVYADCPGELKSTSTRLTSYPPLYHHICTVCGKAKNIARPYPYETVEHDETVEIFH